MPQGLQVFDSSGNVTLDTSTFTLKETIYESSVITSATTVTGLPITSSTVVSVDITTSDPNIPTVTVDDANDQVIVSGTGTYSLKFSLWDIP